MAVPKKKISYSKTKKRYFAIPLKFTSYIQCNSCLNFNKLHCICSFCIFKDPSVKLFLNYSKTNLLEVYK
jgi:ribosomal protein L32